MPASPGVPDTKKVALPLVYALLSSKTQLQYAAVFEAVRSSAAEYGIANCEPRSIMSDFELGIVNAAEEKFPNAKIELCFFHLKKSLYRNVQELGLQVPYQDHADSSVRDFCHMLAALAYVPVNDVRAAFRVLTGTAPNVVGIPELISYFGETYVIGIPGAGRRRAVSPRYPPHLWNVHQITLEKRSATNNASEGWHNRFAQMLERTHPDLYTLLEGLRSEHGDTVIAILELRMGRRIRTATKKKWIDLQNRVRTVVEGYNTYGIARIVEYLELVSHNISFE